VGVELSFASETLRTLCTSPERALAALPAAVCDELQARLADLDAADSMADLVVGGPEIDDTPPGGLRYALPTGYELVCIGGYPNPPLNADGAIRRDRMRRLKVLKVGEI
jgi:hypothetical protein